MKKKINIMDRIMRALQSFAVSYAFVVITYVAVSALGVFSPIDNTMAVRLMSICLVIAVIHFALGFLEPKRVTVFHLICFVVMVAVVLFMGGVVYDFFPLNLTFFVCLGVMLVVVFAGTYLVAYFDDWKKIREINEIIRQNKK